MHTVIMGLSTLNDCETLAMIFSKSTVVKTFRVDSVILSANVSVTFWSSAVNCGTSAACKFYKKNIMVYYGQSKHCVCSLANAFDRNKNVILP